MRAVGDLVVPQRTVVDPLVQRCAQVAVDRGQEAHHHADQGACQPCVIARDRIENGPPQSGSRGVTQRAVGCDEMLDGSNERLAVALAGLGRVRARVGLEHMARRRMKVAGAGGRNVASPMPAAGHHGTAVGQAEPLGADARQYLVDDVLHVHRDFVAGLQRGKQALQG